MKTVVIAEKPSVAQDLAESLGAHQRKDGYIAGNGYAFTWAFGHLVEIKTPEENQKWKLEDLPLLPDTFAYQPTRDFESKTYEPDPGVVKQLGIIEQLFEQCEEIIVATDAGREGELIFRLIYEYLGCNKPFQRLWISSFTNEAIQKGFANLQPGANYDALSDAAKCRSFADWILGVNATRAVSIPINDTISLGRVQTPTLAMICKRYLENTQFKPEKYYQLQVSLEKNTLPFKALSTNSYQNIAEAEHKLGTVSEQTEIQVTTLEKKEKKEAAPLLYDLTTLQQDANKRFSFSADKTLSIAQKLYENKFISYPRTGSRYIGDDIFAEIPDLLEKLKGYVKFNADIQKLQSQTLNKRSVNAAKVTDHHALYYPQAIFLQAFPKMNS